MEVDSFRECLFHVHGTYFMSMETYSIDLTSRVIKCGRPCWFRSCTMGNSTSIVVLKARETTTTLT